MTGLLKSILLLGERGTRPPSCGSSLQDAFTLHCLMRFTKRRLRRAASRTDWFSFTHDVLPALVVAIVTGVATWQLGHKDPNFNAYEALPPIAAGFVALIGTYFVLNLAEFASRWGDAGAQLRSEDEAARQRESMQGGADQYMKNWLRAALADPQLGVAFAAAFGSVVRNDPTRDVDVIVQLAGAGRRDLRNRTIAIKRMAKPFMEIYGLPLHLQFFSVNEMRDMTDFVGRTGHVEVLFGDQRWEKLCDQNT